MPISNKFSKDVLELLKALGSTNVDDAMKLIAVLHPTERRTRTIVVFVVLATGVLLLFGSAAFLALGEPIRQLMVFPLLLGAALAGAALGVAVGQPNSAKQIATVTKQLSAALAESGRAPASTASGQE